MFVGRRVLVEVESLALLCICVFVGRALVEVESLPLLASDFYSEHMLPILKKNQRSVN